MGCQCEGTAWTPGMQEVGVHTRDTMMVGWSQSRPMPVLPVGHIDCGPYVTQKSNRFVHRAQAVERGYGAGIAPRSLDIASSAWSLCCVHSATPYASQVCLPCQCNKQSPSVRLPGMRTTSWRGVAYSRDVLVSPVRHSVAC
jgi:hypothetical protein